MNCLECRQSSCLVRKQLDPVQDNIMSCAFLPAELLSVLQIQNGMLGLHTQVQKGSAQQVEGNGMLASTEQACHKPHEPKLTSLRDTRT